MNFRYSCVPRGSTRAMYSAPMMATANASGLRLSVETITSPPGLTSAAKACNRGRRVGNVLEHFHAGHEIEGGGAFAAPAPPRRRLDSPPRTLLSSACSSATSSTGRDRSMPSTRRAGARHRLGQDAAAAADVENLGCRRFTGALDVLQTQWD